MPASLLTEILLRGIFEIILYGMGYLVGRVVVPIFSLGYYSVEPWDFSSRKKPKNRPAHLLPKQISADAACGFGLATLALAATIAFLIWRTAGA